MFLRVAPAPASRNVGGLQLCMGLRLSSGRPSLVVAARPSGEAECISLVRAASEGLAAPGIGHGRACGTRAGRVGRPFEQSACSFLAQLYTCSSVGLGAWVEHQIHDVTQVWFGPAYRQSYNRIAA